MIAVPTHAAAIPSAHNPPRIHPPSFSFSFLFSPFSVAGAHPPSSPPAIPPAVHVPPSATPSAPPACPSIDPSSVVVPRNYTECPSPSAAGAVREPKVGLFGQRGHSIPTQLPVAEGGRRRSRTEGRPVRPTAPFHPHTIARRQGQQAPFENQRSACSANGAVPSPARSPVAEIPSLFPRPPIPSPIDQRRHPLLRRHDPPDIERPELRILRTHLVEPHVGDQSLDFHRITRE